MHFRPQRSQSAQRQDIYLIELCVLCALRGKDSNVYLGLSAIFHQSTCMGQKQRHHIRAVNTAQPSVEKGRLPESFATVSPYSSCGNTDGHRMPGVALETPGGGVVSGDAENIRFEVHKAGK